jgi:hypothetical protein
MKIQVGKTYLTRDGTMQVKVERELSNKNKWRFQCLDDRGRVTWRNGNGAYLGALQHPHDLIEEAAP